ncbi:MAG: hypothetical protein NC253_02140 [Ruminococcus sp.]|nr:hypothetical protein [Ruminococcus sp.]MCM1480650.1 hypothetical protein [Muribaculaceae bacterium]
MKRILCTLIAAAIVAAAAAVTAFAEDRLIFVKSEPAPAEVTEYAEEMFAYAISEHVLTTVGLTESEAKSAALAAPLVMRDIYPDPDDGYTSYYFPIVCGGKVTAFFIVNRAPDGKLGWQSGKQDIEERFNEIKSSPADPAEIYVENNDKFGATFAVAGDEITVLRNMFDEDKTEQINDLKKLRAEDTSTNYVINVYGYTKKGWFTLDGEKYFIKQDGTLATKNTTIGGKRYKFAADGRCLGTFTGFVKSGNNRYYYKNGVKKTGDFTVKGKTYHADENGIIY